MKHLRDAWRSTAVTVLLALCGIGVLLYPVVASQWNNARQQHVARQYAQEERQVPPELLTETLRSAEEYNKQTPGAPILDPWLARVAKTNDPYQAYLRQLAILPEMGRLVIPATHVNLPIYHGTSDEVLQKGIGHLYGSSLPVGGPGTHAVLTGHSGLSSATLLDNLSKVSEGDALYLQVAGREMKYQVTSIKVVKPDEVASLARVEGEDLLTVITCTPYGINSHRLLVTGRRVPLEEAGVPDVAGIAWPTWMIAILVVCALALVWLLWWLIRRKHNDDEKTDSVLQPARPPARHA
ncbi:MULTISPECIES: class C sortase [Actinotignum]|uniref:Class C sortase n=1 Tax=Actinotignum timonense TaxID=1870995 RepID=A0AAW9HDB9_9ACTO|nr:MULTISPECIES: class C sortase [Actinotignum]MBS5749252.1 class C sortase [Actinotignum schaalii]MDE1559204.1 class C sortase [Actinotignum schaalii]MDE1664204.1 class C sortase [Actinotignum schaalii]MDK6372761.1 class C sortase [Actinotignum timonense]MDK6419653.1 class C sortase [Actinotignum timonense]